MQPGFDLRPVTVPYRFDEQVAEPLVPEELAEDVENAAAERLTL